MIQAALTERPVHAPIREKDVMIRFNVEPADGEENSGIGLKKAHM